PRLEPLEEARAAAPPQRARAAALCSADGRLRLPAADGSRGCVAASVGPRARDDVAALPRRLRQPPRRRLARLAAAAGGRPRADDRARRAAITSPAFRPALPKPRHQ